MRSLIASVLFALTSLVFAGPIYSEEFVPLGTEGMTFDQLPPETQQEFLNDHKGENIDLGRLRFKYIPPKGATPASNSKDLTPEQRQEISGIFDALKMPSMESRTSKQRAVEELLDVYEFSCARAYPKRTDEECLEVAKHGVVQAFDPHSEYMNKDEARMMQEDYAGKFGGLGIELQKVQAAPLTVVNALDDAPAKKAGVLAGDLITHIVSLKDGKEDAVATTSIDLTKAVSLMRGKVGTPVILKIKRKGVDKTLSFRIVRDEIVSVQITGDLIKDGDKTYALIHNKKFEGGNKDAFKAKYLELEKRAGGRSKLSGVVISEEGDPGGVLEESMADVDLFGDFPSIVLMRTNNGIEPYQFDDKLHTPGDITKGLPILVVVDGGSASASEVFAAAMKHFGRAVIAGRSKTFGKGIVQSIFPKSDDRSAIKLTTSEYLIGSLTDWVPVQCVGVEPDIMFEYPGIKKPFWRSECELNGHVGTGGPMKNAPLHRSIKEANPSMYHEAEVMLKAYIAYQTPKLAEEEAKRKAIEKEED